MRLTTMAALLLTTSAVAAGAQSPAGAPVASPADVKWGPAPAVFPAGALTATVGVSYSYRLWKDIQAVPSVELYVRDQKGKEAELGLLTALTLDERREMNGLWRKHWLLEHEGANSQGDLFK